MSAGPFRAVLFKSGNHTILAETILKEAGIPHKLIPVPKEISPDCGVCLRVEEMHLEEVKTALAQVEAPWTVVEL
jgi:hypothetical protein